MANHKSAIKRHKQSLKRAARNRSQRTRVKNIIKKAQLVIGSEVRDAADKAVSMADSIVQKAVAKGAIHWKTAARKISRLAKMRNKTLAQ